MEVTAAPMRATTRQEDSPVPALPGLVCWQTGKPVRVSRVSSPCLELSSLDVGVEVPIFLLMKNPVSYTHLTLPTICSV